MRLSIKTKQVLTVTTIVGAVVVALSLLHLSALVHVSLEESKARGELLARAAYQRTQAVVARSADPYASLRDDAGLRAILQSSLYSKNVTYAAVVDPSGVIVADLDPTRVGRPLEPRARIEDLLARNELEQLWEIFIDEGRTVEVVEPLTLLEPSTGAGREFGAIRVGISTLLVRDELRKALKPAIGTALAALLIATGAAMVLAQLLLRPIHLLRSSLTRLQQGESNVRVDLPGDEFGDLGSFFNAVSEKLSADRNQLAGQKASLESVVDRLEDAVGVFNPQGELLVANPALRALLPASDGDRPVALPATHPWRELLHTTIATRQSRGPVSTGPVERGEGDWLLMTHPIEDVGQRLIGVMLIARNLATLSQVQSTLNYSRKLTALGRLSAGVAHEVKNPLNAMIIHLELLRQKLSGARPRMHARAGGPTSIVAAVDPVPIDAPAALEHVEVIQSEIRRLDQVLQGFLKFTRPEDLQLQPVTPADLLREVAQVIEPEAQKTRVKLEVDCGPRVPDINGDPGMLRQALLNLALNACQAMPNGGMLSFRCRPSRGRRVEIRVEDTGVGISPDHLGRVFDLYFTTRQEGSGIGLSMVYRTVQLHDGDIEVQSTPGKGTIFTLKLPAA